MRKNVVILAAGDGKRMHAPHAKVLCEVAGKPMLSWVIDTARSVDDAEICVVVSPEADDVRELAEKAGCSVCYQYERKGTGHAVMAAREFLEANIEGNTLVLCGDAPFMDAATVKAALSEHEKWQNAVTVITAVLEDGGNYGRIVRDGDTVKEIVEKKDCKGDKADIADIREINSGAYWFETGKLLGALDRLTDENAQKEYYLTDTVGLLYGDGESTGGYPSFSSDIVLGANDPRDLLELNEKACAAIIDRHLENGVRFRSRDGVIISPDVVIEEGAEILQGCTLTGKTRIGSRAVIGPNSMLTDTEIGEDTVFESSKATQAKVGRKCNIGPYVQLRPDSIICDEVKIGDFVEIKNSTIGTGTSVAHLTYIGDAEVGRCCNFGCGTVFVNYDGVTKNRIKVGDFCFIGCNTNLIAPVTLGDGAYTAAGTTVTRDIPAGALVIDRGQLVIKDGWAARKLKKYIEKQKGRHGIE